MERKWWHGKVAYQIYPKSFYDSNGDGIGDLPGITSKLDYLKDLGVDIVWISPIYPSPFADQGYDISDYYNIDPCFGTLEDMDTLLKEAQKRDMYILMDLVVNHCSDEHEWFEKACQDPDGEYGNFFYIEDRKEGEMPCNWRSYFGGPVWEPLPGHPEKQYMHVFHKKQPDLNWENPKVRDEVFSMMDWWCQKGIDGFRMDVISMISKVEGLPDGKVSDGLHGDPSPFVQNGPRVHEYLQEMNQRVLSKYDLLTVGECPGVTVEEAQRYASDKGTELGMVFQFEHMGLDEGEFSKWSDRKIKLTDLKENLTKWQNGLDGKAWNSLYWCNHDQPRVLSRFGNDSKEYREVSAKMLGTCLHMMQGTPYVYQGEELGMTNVPFKSIDDFRDIESIRAYQEYVESGIIDKEDMMRFLCYKSRDNARTPMQWNSGKNAGFTEGTPWIMVNPNYKEINAEEQVDRADSVFNYYKKLIELRHKEEVIVYGHYELLMPESEELYVYTRELENEKILVICNFTEKEVKYTLPEEFENGKILISNYDKMSADAEMELKPYEAMVIKKA